MIRTGNSGPGSENPIREQLGCGLLMGLFVPEKHVPGGRVCLRRWGNEGDRRHTRGEARHTHVVQNEACVAYMCRADVKTSTRNQKHG